MFVAVSTRNLDVSDAMGLRIEAESAGEADDSMSDITKYVNGTCFIYIVDVFFH